MQPTWPFQICSDRPPYRKKARGFGGGRHAPSVKIHQKVCSQRGRLKSIPTAHRTENKQGGLGGGTPRRKKQGGLRGGTPPRKKAGVSGRRHALQEKKQGRLGGGGMPPRKKKGVKDPGKKSKSVREAARPPEKTT